MIIISYDISDDKTRTKFAKFLSKHGYRLQYSVFTIENSERILNIVIQQIEDRFKKRFSETDSVLIYPVEEKKMIKYGYASHEDDDLIIIG